MFCPYAFCLIRHFVCKRFVTLYFMSFYMFFPYTFCHIICSVDIPLSLYIRSFGHFVVINFVTESIKYKSFLKQTGDKLIFFWKVFSQCRGSPSQSSSNVSIGCIKLKNPRAKSVSQLETRKATGHIGQHVLACSTPFLPNFLKVPHTVLVYIYQKT